MHTQGIPMQYESMYIISSELEEKDTTNKIEEIKITIVKQGAKILHETSWGKRKLVRPIGKEKHGSFFIVNYESEPEVVAKIENKLKFAEGIIRSVTLKQPYVEEVKKATPLPTTEQVEKGSTTVDDTHTDQETKESTETRVKKAAVARSQETKEKIAKREKEREKETSVDLEGLDKKLDKILDDDMDL